MHHILGLIHQLILHHKVLPIPHKVLLDVLHHTQVATVAHTHPRRTTHILQEIAHTHHKIAPILHRTNHTQVVITHIPHRTTPILGDVLLHKIPTLETIIHIQEAITLIQGAITPIQEKIILTQEETRATQEIPRTKDRNLGVLMVQWPWLKGCLGVS